MLVKRDDNKLDDFEYTLLSLFTYQETPSHEKDVSLSLKEFYKEVSAACENKNIDFVGRYYSQIVNDFHEKEVKCDYNKLLFRCFIFAIYRQHFSYPKTNTNNPTSNMLDYRVKFTKQNSLPKYLIEFEKRFYPLAI